MGLEPDRAISSGLLLFCQDNTRASFQPHNRQASPICEAFADGAFLDTLVSVRPAAGLAHGSNISTGE